MPVQETFGEASKCSICKLSEIDTLNYGEIHGKKELAVHLFCLVILSYRFSELYSILKTIKTSQYFSTKLPQRGRDNSGILGFEFRDLRSLIKSSIKTVSPVKCRSFKQK